jgi:hypothetical protein
VPTSGTSGEPAGGTWGRDEDTIGPPLIDAHALDAVVACPFRGSRPASLENVFGPTLCRWRDLRLQAIGWQTGFNPAPPAAPDVSSTVAGHESQRFGATCASRCQYC